MADIHYQLKLVAPLCAVHAAISDPERIGSWWDEATVGMLEGYQSLTFHPGEGHGVLEMLVVHDQPDRIVWRCVSEHASASLASAWTGTEIEFVLSEVEAGTRLDFRHLGWDSDNRWFGFCSDRWAMALQTLTKYCEGRA